MSINRDLSRRMLHQREEKIHHLEYNLEFRFYNSVASGDMSEVSKYLLDANNCCDSYSRSEYGQLSKDTLQNARYHFVVAVALITRICVEKGLERETAYTLSDLFIQKMDELSSIEEVSKLHNEMVIEFTTIMRKVRKEKVYSIHVLKAMDYIAEHLHEKINTEQIAEELSLNRSYICSLFHREMGKTLHQYIVSEKVKSAAQMLITSDISYSDAAEYYSFSSQSHFIQCFQKETGFTPMKYRKRFYQKSGV